MFFIVTSLAQCLQAVPTGADVSSSYRPNLTDTPIASSTTSNNRSLQDNRSETCNSSSALRATNCILIASAPEEHSNSVQQQNCNILLENKHGDRQIQGCSVSDILQAAFNSTAHFFCTDNTSSNKSVFRYIHDCMKAWPLATLPDSSNGTHVMPTGIPQTETSIQFLDEAKAYADILRNILESSSSKVRNISTRFLYNRDYHTGAMAVQEFENYLTQLELMVQSMKDFSVSLDLYNFSAMSEISWVNCILPFGKWEHELKTERHRYGEVLDMFIKVKVLEIFRRYVDPAVYFAILVVGLLWNGVLLFIFALHRQLWTSANIMIFNLAVGDILSIILNLPFFYIAHYHVQYFQMNEYACKLYTTLRPLCVAASALSVVALSILRYVASGKSLTGKGCKLSKRSRTILCILIVWILAIGLSVPYSFVLEFTAGKCFVYGDGYTAKMVAVSEFLFYCVILPWTMVHFNILTARNLSESTRSLSSAMRRNGQDIVRKRSASVLTALIVVFLISYIPQHLWRVLYRWLVLDIWEVPYRCIDKVTYYMLFANSCFNPICLYGVSKRFRKLFNHYFLYVYNHYCNKNSNSHLRRFKSSFLIYANSVQSKL